MLPPNHSKHLSKRPKLRALLRPLLDVHVFCGILGTASEVGFGKRVIERKPLDESYPRKVSLPRPRALRGRLLPRSLLRGALLLGEPLVLTVEVRREVQLQHLHDPYIISDESGADGKKRVATA